MQRFLAQLSSVGFLASVLARRAFALDDPTEISGLASETSLTEVILDIITLILDFTLILAVLFVIIAGLRLIISAGDESQKEGAKKTIIYVIVGIVIILFARAIVVFIDNYFTEGADV